MSVAFLCSGQGAQHPGMGLAFAEKSEQVRALFDRAEQLRPGTRAQMSADADPAVLSLTENTQPCLYLADLAAALYLEECGLHADCVAGFSLGELPALAFAGAFSPEEGFRIVCERASLMGREAHKKPAGMLAVLKLENAQVEAICKRFEGLYPVNYNAPGQLVVAGEKSVIDAAKSAFVEAGGRALPLNVSGGFHSPLMTQAANDFDVFLAGCVMCAPKRPVYANRTAAPYTASPAATLAHQIDHPVRWEETVRAMAQAGVDVFVETGVGTTLRKLVQKILPDAKVYSVETPEEADVVAKEVAGC